MALYGLLGDVHGNLEALEAVLHVLAGRGVSRLVCLGDLIGFGADPNECVAALRARDALSIAGNHDLIGVRRLGFSRCAPRVAYALRRTRRALSAGTVAYLAGLPLEATLEEGVLLFHGGLGEPERYLTTEGLVRKEAARVRASRPSARLCFFGHTHEPRVYEIEGERVREQDRGGVVALRRDGVVMVNPGSVDASRKPGEKMAECAVFDSEGWTVEFHRQAYDHAAAEAKAARDGYRVGPLTLKILKLQRRVRERLLGDEAETTDV